MGYLRAQPPGINGGELWAGRRRSRPILLGVLRQRVLVDGQAFRTISCIEKVIACGMGPATKARIVAQRKLRGL
jgi:hypothetical protein